MRMVVKIQELILDNMIFVGAISSHENIQLKDFSFIFAAPFSLQNRSKQEDHTREVLAKSPQMPKLVQLIRRENNS